MQTHEATWAGRPINGDQGWKKMASKLGQIGPKWDKSGIFSDQVSVYFASVSQNVLKLILKKSHICPILGQSKPIWMPNLKSLTLWRVPKQAGHIGKKWVIFARYGLNMGIFQIRWLYILDIQKSQNCTLFYQFGPILAWSETPVLKFARRTPTWDWIGKRPWTWVMNHR